MSFSGGSSVGLASLFLIDYEVFNGITISSPNRNESVILCATELLIPNYLAPDSLNAYSTLNTESLLSFIFF